MTRFGGYKHTKRGDFVCLTAVHAIGFLVVVSNSSTGNVVGTEQWVQKGYAAGKHFLFVCPLHVFCLSTGTICMMYDSLIDA